MKCNNAELTTLFFCNRRNSFLSFGGPQLYNLEALSFTHDQYVVRQALKPCYCSLLCESMNFHPDKQLFQVAGTGDQTTDPWITKPALYLYTMGDPLDWAYACFYKNLFFGKWFIWILLFLPEKYLILYPLAWNSTTDNQPIMIYIKCKLSWVYSHSTGAH